MITKDTIDLTIVGVNYHNAPLEIRNKFAFSVNAIQKVYQDADGPLANDIFILSTCNRTEIYTTTNDLHKLFLIFEDYAAVTKEEIRKYTFVKEGDEAIRHLFKVASGIDSQILGDYEIVRQIKNAFTLAKEYNKVNGLLEKLLNAALKASKQIKATTNISDGTTSVSYAAVKLLKQEMQEGKPQNICLMGLGKIGALTLKNLLNYLPEHSLTLINRDQSKAEAFAADYSVKYAKEDQHKEVLHSSDTLIIATGADHALITKEHIQGTSIKLIFDLAVPSNVSADVREIEGVKLFDIDQLSRIVDETIENRKKQIPLAIEIIEENIEEYKEWKKRRHHYLTKLSEEQSAALIIR
jgi:glutamyl-tRNA reductase